jgi:hypothetical protein
LAKERLREEPGRGTVIVVGIVGIVVVELDLVVVEVEVRGAIEGAILIAKFALVHL